jgi:hypothetical protein
VIDDLRSSGGPKNGRQRKITAVIGPSRPPAILAFGTLSANNHYLRLAGVHCGGAAWRQSAPEAAAAKGGD